MSERTVSNPNRNRNLTKKCAHGPSSACDYCIIAYDDHHVRAARAADRRKGGHMLGRERFQCAECPKKRGA